jgi:hypothetical protein
MNMTPTCVCDQGYVAVAQPTEGGRGVDCVAPDEVVPPAFYEKRLAALPLDLPGGRDVGVPEVEALDLPPSNPPTIPEPPSGAFPMPRANPDYPPATRATNTGSGGCHLARPREPAGSLARFGALLFGAVAWGRARRRR